ncbi:hypothetical protein I316_06158 [Kwoniella heveanensis BCC8398]|uniref:Uncharacterized protein n=1 Tax=Kwoniella heveanensis BCC8398 TaxID=1296120 RepID=A0A1B9GMN4_9TREE|nr:hypothetical protein I316_06158 [Kwoniella heveanensis BCC8398]
MYSSSSISAPLPPYTPPSAHYRKAHPQGGLSGSSGSGSDSDSDKKGISVLPIHLIHRILSLTLDQRATPSTYWSDPEEERVRRIWALFRGLRGVNRVFWLVSTSILRAMYLESYLSYIKPGYSSDPFPFDSSHLSDPSLNLHLDSSDSTYGRGGGRETAVFDRYIAVKVGEELREVESALSEGSEAVGDIFHRLQPAARIEDLLLTLPPNLIVPSISSSSSNPIRSLPLPQTHLSVKLTPSWAAMYLHSAPVAISRALSRTSEGGGSSKELVVEVRRTSTLEGTVKMIGDGLDDISRRLVTWGDRVL